MIKVTIQVEHVGVEVEVVEQSLVRINPTNPVEQQIPELAERAAKRAVEAMVVPHNKSEWS